ncbi:helix-turn-helix domain-containing protein [Desulfopila sp. IMCC35008]|uniref:helix-turn-helix domain-containing protein n=1 Tax=Desulfopila sp. IMCC35008 TaxID=2653858 RepID=UPI0013CF81EF|nr:helix-turn-helix domain-containing protein [Desulfopila sp. IMCC35008]
MTRTTDNPELLLAHEFVRYTNCNIFLTGKAGTGKTTFLHDIALQSEKRLIITAPTGVAAINAGGVTLHSFFQMPFSPFVPGAEMYNEQRHHRMSREKKNIIRSLDLLVIDEISMVRADLLDCVDHMLRRHRRSDKPFGGVQLLMIGDLHQLPPVVRDQEWQLLRNHYQSPYFFSSTALSKTELIPIELKKIYRQSDQTFIDILNQVRNNQLEPATLKKLNSRLDPDFYPADDEGYITLCTHNSRADSINVTKLAELTGPGSFFNAELEGDFPEHAYPTIDTLELKKGAQVMFVRNDPSPDKEYFNGKIGTIMAIDDEEILVKCQDDANMITVARTTWQNTKYTLDPETNEISTEVIGTFTQYPLKLAWAITIHKSQGLTFDRAIIDAEAAFAHGQVYVALSRCRTFEGLVLSSPVASSGIKSDQTVNQFVRHAEQNPPTTDKLDQAKIRYQQQLLHEAFSFNNLRAALNNLVRVLERNATVIHVTGVSDPGEIYRRTEEEIFQVGENFRRQLTGLFQDSTLPGDDPAIRERLAKAANYFRDKITSLPGTIANNLTTETDNKEIRKKLKNGQKWLMEATAVKLAAVESCGEDFSPPRYLRAISNVEVELSKPQKTTKSSINYSESDIAHPELFEKLKAWRAQKAQKDRLAPFHIMHQKTLIQLTIQMPDTLADFQKVKGIGKKLTEKYGAELVEQISMYRKEHGISTVILPDKKEQKDTPEEKKLDPHRGKTKEYTLELFRTGLDIKQIADKRELTTTTIEGHLAHWVKSGDVAVGDVIEKTKIKPITKAIQANPGSTFKQIKEALDDEFSYGEIKLVFSHLSATGGISS